MPTTTMRRSGFVTTRRTPTTTPVRQWLLLTAALLVLSLLLALDTNANAAPSTTTQHKNSPASPSSPGRPHRYGGRTTLYHRAILASTEGGGPSEARRLFEQALSMPEHAQERVDDEDEQRKTPLIRAVERGDLERAGWLLKEAGANPRIGYLPGSPRGHSPLWLAVSQGDLAMVRLLSGEEPDCASEQGDTGCAWTPTGGRGSTGDQRVITDAGTGQGVTPLAEAARLGRLDILEYLLRGEPHRSQVCVVGCRDHLGMDAWLQACAHGHAHIAGRLLRELDFEDRVQEAEAEMEAQREASGKTTTGASRDAVSLRKSKYVRQADRRGMGCLLHAIQGEHPEFVETLLLELLAGSPGLRKARRALLRQAMDSGETPLIAALRLPARERGRVVRTLLAAAGGHRKTLEAMLSARGPLGRTPLHMAAAAGDLEAAHAVLEHAETLSREARRRLVQAVDNSGQKPAQLVVPNHGGDEAKMQALRERFLRLGDEAGVAVSHAEL